VTGIVETREPVTRERAVRVAIGRADANGIESLSMRKLAAELGVEAMSLYYHLRNKSDLLDAMLDAVYAEFDTPTREDQWRDAMSRRARSMRAVWARHSWALEIGARTSPGSATLRHLDAAIGCLRAAEFSMVMIGHALSVLDSYVRGFAQEEIGLPLDSSGGITPATEDIIAQQQRMAEDYPNLAAMAAELIMQPGYAYGNEFEFGLTVVLDGIASAHTAERRSGS